MAVIALGRWTKNTLRRRVRRLRLAQSRYRMRLGMSKSGRQASPPARALAWIRAHENPTGGIRVHSRDSNAYPEVTGYLVPTLLQYGERELATRLVRWLLCIQRADGSYTGPDGVSYTFDTGQVLRALLAGRDLVPGSLDAARRAADYLCAQVIEGGRRGFDRRYPGISESIHLYVLPPLVQAAEVLQNADYRATADRCLDFYCAHADALRVSSLTHYLGYELEALIDLGLAERAVPILDALREQQTADGAVRGEGDARWVCAPGLAQLAVCWYKLGQWEPADKALTWLEAHQEPSGGWLGSYGPGASYIPTAEVSWAPKFCLDANLLRVKAFFDRNAHSFPSTVPAEDGRAQAILALVRPSDRVLEVGCGKGRFLEVVHHAHPQTQCTGVDISAALLSSLPKEIRALPGSLESIPCPDGAFDVVFSVEAVEHSANPEAAIAEMIRTARPGGWVAVIDKQQSQWGRFTCPPWERWPDAEYLKRFLDRWCDNVTYEPVSYDGHPADGLMLVWRGQKRSRLAGRGADNVPLDPAAGQAVVKAPLVSIVLPTYNGARYVSQAIGSCLSQAYSNWELIVVDDASTDDTPAMIAGYVERDRRIRSVRHETNRRLPGALNTGFAEARGKYLTWTSDDNFYAPDALAEMVTFLEQHPETDVVYTDRSIIDENGQLLRRVVAPSPDQLAKGNCVGPCFLYRRRVMDVVGDYCEDLFLAEDYDFWLRASVHFRLVPLHRDLYSYRVHRASLTALGGQQIRRATETALLRNLPKMRWLTASARADSFWWMAQKARHQRDRVAMGKFVVRAFLWSPGIVIGDVARRLARKVGRGQADSHEGA